MNDDATLLRRYVDQRDESAFAELVGRHVDLVYAAAVRRTRGDHHLAGEVAQEVFTALARHARTLATHPALAAWLHTATRNAAFNRMTAHRRRLERETAAHALAANAVDSPDWDQVRPLLDAAIDELPEADRTAVILRFLQQHPFAVIGAALRVSEDAARMRTDRALEKLRLALARRGIVSTAAALGTLVATQPLVSAPVGLASQFATHATAHAGASALGLSLFTAMNTKIVLVSVASAAIAFFFGTRMGQASSVTAPDRSELTRQEQTLASLRGDNQRLAADLMRANEALALARTQATTPAAAPTPATTAEARRSIVIGLQKWEIQENTLANLRQIDAARQQYQLEKGRIAGSISDLVGRKSYIKTVRPVDGEDYAGLSMDPTQPLTVNTAGGLAVTFDPAGSRTTQPEFPPEVVRTKELAQRIQPHIGTALSAYRQANGGKSPPNEQALVPYFSSPKEGADFVEFLEAKKAAGL